MSAGSALYAGMVTHRRLRPRRHRLSYRVFSLLLDLDELPELHRRLRWFSFNRWNLFSVHERDHGLGRAGLCADVRARLRAAGFDGGGPVRLLTMPRILGYAFNPLDVYFCHAADGALEAVLYEVNNTFGERHGYLLGVDERHRGGSLSQACPKRLHVSPFLALDMRYAFRLWPPDDAQARLRLGIAAHDATGPVLVAHYEARRRALDDAALLRVFFTHPLLTLKVVAGIHLEALRLWLKGLPVHRHPGPPARPLTVIARKGPSA